MRKFFEGIGEILNYFASDIFEFGLDWFGLKDAFIAIFGIVVLAAIAWVVIGYVIDFIRGN